MKNVRAAQNLSDRLWEFRKVLKMIVMYGKPGPNPMLEQSMPALIEMTTSMSLKPYALEDAALWPEEMWHCPDDLEDCLTTIEKVTDAAGPMDAVASTVHKTWECPASAGKSLVEVPDLESSVVIDDDMDKVLVVALIPSLLKTQGEEAALMFMESGGQVGPKWGISSGHMMLAWLDSPGKGGRRSDYTVSCKGSQGCVFKEPKQLSAMAFSDKQTTHTTSREPSVIDQGRWYNVPGTFVSSVLEGGEKVLVVCSIPYVCCWTDASTRGAFRVVRDGESVHTDLGGQTVMASEDGAKNTLVMSLVDSPGAGFHLYQLQATVFTDSMEAQMMQIDDELRQMSVIRLPGNMVVGPSKPGKETAPCLLDSPDYVAIPGMKAKVTLKSSTDQALIMFNTNLIPVSEKYKAQFTIFRTDAAGKEANVVDSESLWVLDNSETTTAAMYPSSMFMDKPGAGTFTYTLKGMVAKDSTVMVGPHGQMSAVICPSRR